MKALSVSNITLKSWLRSKSGIFFSFLFPLLLLLVFGTVFGGSGSTSFSIFVQNQDTVNGTGIETGTELSSSFISALNGTGAVDITMIPAGEDARAFAKSHSGSFSNYRILIIPEGFHDNMMSGTSAIRMNITYETLSYLVQRYGQLIPQNQSAGLQAGLEGLGQAVAGTNITYVGLVYIYDPSDQGATIARGIIESVASAFNYRLIGASEVIYSEDETYAATTFRAVDYYMPGYIAAFIMTNGVIGLTGTMTDLRRRNVIKRLLPTPLTKFDWIAGNIITQIVMGVLLTAVMIIFGYTVFGIVAVPDMLSVAVLLVGIIAFSGLGMILGGIVKNVEASTALGNAIAFPMMFLSGSFWPLDVMPGYMQEVAKILPLTYFANGLRNAMLYKDAAGALFNLEVLSAIAAVFILAGVIAIKWREH